MSSVLKTELPDIARPLRVLMLSHGCQSRTEAQPKAVLLAQMADITLRVLTPDRWMDYGKWRIPQAPINESFDLRPTRVRFPWLGPAQSYLHYYPDLSREIAEFGPDVINVWEEPWSLVSAHACRLRDKMCPSTKIIVETEQNILKRLPPPFRQIRRYVLSKADGIVARSREAIGVVRSIGYSGIVKMVPNAVDTQLFRPHLRDQCLKILRKRAGVDWSNRFVVGFVGRMVVEKGIFELLEAIESCPSDVSLLMVGSGPCWERVRKLAEERNLQDRIVNLKALPHDQLPELFGAMDVLAVPSRTTSRWKEQFGRVIIEAHACAIPVIGSSSGAIPDVIANGGRVVPEKNAQQLASAIMELRDNLSLRQRLGEQGLQQVMNDYSWQSVAERMRRFYRQISAGNLSIN
jgi:glycosyltransferase involved in cell wall biosynthesis